MAISGAAIGKEGKNFSSRTTRRVATSAKGYAFRSRLPLEGESGLIGNLDVCRDKR